MTDVAAQRSTTTMTLYLVWRARWTGNRVLLGVFVDRSLAYAESHDADRWVEERTVVTDIEENDEDDNDDTDDASD